MLVLVVDELSLKVVTWPSPTAVQLPADAHETDMNLPKNGDPEAALAGATVIANTANIATTVVRTANPPPHVALHAPRRATNTSIHCTNMLMASKAADRYVSVGRSACSL